MAHPRRTIGVCAVAVFHPEGVVSFIPVSTEDFGKRADIGHPRPRVQRRKGQVERRR